MQTQTVIMPSELTAANGAKSLLMGEFSEEIEMQCPECDQDECDEDCEICSGNYTYLQKVPVTWATIKAIYAKAAEHFGV